MTKQAEIKRQALRAARFGERLTLFMVMIFIA